MNVSHKWVSVRNPESIIDVHSDEEKAYVSIGRSLPQRLRRTNTLPVLQRTLQGGTACVHVEVGIEARRAQQSLAEVWN